MAPRCRYHAYHEGQYNFPNDDEEQDLLDMIHHVFYRIIGDRLFPAPFKPNGKRSAAQDTWTYRFFGAYDNVVGPPDTAPTHGTELPFFHGGNECFGTLAGVTPEQQALADSVHG